jgi:uncharacterized surface protein with fasciclin (FAS1) repeats
MIRLKPNYMKMSALKKGVLLILILFSGFYACQDPWEERIQVKGDVPANNLMEEILSRPELSQFAQYLQTTRWDTLLTTTKAYTLWAPTNDALNSLDAGMTNSNEKITALVRNHICPLQYEYYTAGESIRLKTFEGKYITLDFVNYKVNDAHLIEPYDIVANNGILHIIDKPLAPQINIWEFVESTSLCPKLTGYINSLTGEIFDPTIATQIGVDVITGKPVYDTATGLVWDNLFINRTRNLKSEDTLSTLILFSDADYDAEFDKFKEYFLYDDEVENYKALSDSVATWKITKDIVVEGAFEPENLPNELISTFGVKIPIGDFTIDSVFQVSNGFVYIVSNYSIEKPEKIPVIILEGEDTTKIVGRDPFGQTGFTRKEPLASGGFDFILDNHGANPGTLTFYVPDLCNLNYKVYWKAVDDFDYSYRNPSTTDTIKQALGWVTWGGLEESGPVFENFGGIGNPTYVIDSSYATASEVYIYTNRIFGYKNKEWIQLKGEGKNTTLCLDYIKLVPVFQ